MSACITLVKPVDPIKFLNSYIEAEIDPIHLFTHSINVADKPYFNHRYNKQIREVRDKFSEYIIKEDISKVLHTDSEDIKYELDKDHIYYDTILYYQGWDIFKERLFRNNDTLYYATDKKHVRELLDRFLRINKKSNSETLQIYHEIIDKFEDGMILELSW